MGCNLSIKKDEVCPISYTPRNVAFSEKNITTNNNVQSLQYPEKAVTTNGVSAPKLESSKNSANGRCSSQNKTSIENSVTNNGKGILNSALPDKGSATNGITPKAELSSRDITPAENEDKQTVVATKNNNNNNNIVGNNNKHDDRNKSRDIVLSAVNGLEIVRTSDGEGSPITLATFYGTWTAPMPELPEQIMRAQHFTFDPSDVILLGYAKSGTHWLWEMLHMLMTGRAEYCQTPKERLMLSFSSQEFFDTLPAPRLFNCHAPWVGLPPALRTGGNKMVYIVRNPKDVAVSYYHHMKQHKIFDYDGSFRGYLQLFLEGKVPGGSWFDYVRGWEETVKNNPHLPFLMVYYEDLKEDTVESLRRIDQFLELGRSEELLAEISEKCTISKMRHMDRDFKQHTKDHPNKSKNGKGFMYRKGEVGDWKNHFSEADNARMDAMISEKLQNSSLKFRYELEPCSF